METTAYVVVDIWRVKEGHRDAVRSVLAESARVFRAMPGILSVDYSQLEGDPDQYLVVFRYRSAADREAFQHTPELTSVMTRLSALWDLESPVWKGHQTGL